MALLLLLSQASALTTSIKPRFSGRGLSNAPAPAFVEGHDYLCVGGSCMPIDNWFDGPVAPRKLRRSWTVSLAPARKIPSLAKAFNHWRAQVSALSPTTITIIGAFTNVVLAVAKITVGIVANSASLVADGWHSFGDLCSDALCYACHKVGARPPDASHPDGYVRYEHIGTLAIAGMLASSGLLMVVQSGGAALAALRASRAMVAVRPPLSVTDVAALAVALLSVASKELLFGATYAIGVRCRSPSIVANAYHHRSDALSSLVAIAGIGGVLRGCAWLDPLAASAVGLMVVAMGGDVGRESFEALFGHAAAAEEPAPAADGLGPGAAMDKWLREEEGATGEA